MKTIDRIRGKALETGPSAVVLVVLVVALGWMIWPYRMAG